MAPAPVRRRVTPLRPQDVPAAIAHLRAADARLAAAIDRVGPFTIRVSRASPFEALVRTIIDQQLSVKAAATIRGRVVALFPAGRFPSPQDFLAMADEPLRAAGLSRNKLLAIRDLATKTLDGTVPTRRAMAWMSDEEVMARLIAVRGVGRWTAQLLLMELGRPDVLPVDDLVLRRGAGKAFGLSRPPTEEELLRMGEPWRPWRTVASWYLWRSDRATPT